MEYESVCRRAEHLIAAGLTAREADTFVTAVIAMSEPVRIHYLWRPVLRDPADEMVLEVGVNGRADALVTFNRRDFGLQPRRFGLEVLLPGEVAARIRSWQK
jgi:predicted nucleic acid-binding protein